MGAEEGTGSEEGGVRGEINSKPGKKVVDANSHFPRPAGPHFPSSQGHIKRSALEIGRAR